MKAGLAPADVLAGAAGSASRVVVARRRLETDPGRRPASSSATPAIAELPSAGSATTIDMPFTIKDRAACPRARGERPLGSDRRARARGRRPTRRPIRRTGRPAPDPGTGGARARPEAADPANDPDGPGSRPTPAAVPEAQARRISAASGRASPLVVPERVGDVVAPAAVKIGKKALDVPVTLPTAPGRYRLTVTLHDPNGVAYDAATQALLPSLHRPGHRRLRRRDPGRAGRRRRGRRAVLARGPGPEPRQGSRGAAAIKRAVRTCGLAPADPRHVVGRWIPLSACALPADRRRPTARRCRSGSRRASRRRRRSA